jgi:hypothetical protein
MNAPNDSSRYDLFVSYSHRDASAVLAIAEDIRARGNRVFLDAWGIPKEELAKGCSSPGIAVLEHLVRAFSHSSAAVIFCGSGPGASSWVHTERILACIRKRRDPSFSYLEVHLDPPKHRQVRGGQVSATSEYITSSLGLEYGGRADVVLVAPALERDRFDWGRNIGVDFDLVWGTSTEEILVVQQNKHYGWHGDEKEDFIVRIYWDPGLSAFSVETIFSTRSSSSYDHSTGWDTYTDNKIETPNFADDRLTFSVKYLKERENENFLNEHEVLDERTERYEYNVRERCLRRLSSGS